VSTGLFCGFVVHPTLENATLRGSTPPSRLSYRQFRWRVVSSRLYRHHAAAASDRLKAYGANGANRAPGSNWPVGPQPTGANGQTIGLGTLLLALEHLWNKTRHSKGVFQWLPRVRAIESSTRLERAMGIEPTSEAWEACNITQNTLDWRQLCSFRNALIGKYGKWTPV